MFLEIKIRCRAVLHRGQTAPRSLTSGPGSMSTATLAKHAQATVASFWARYAHCREWLAGRRRSSAAGKGRGGGLNGEEAHPEDACKAGKGGGRRRTANRMAEVADACGEGELGGND
jgi:hypothetical protein